MHSTVPEPRTAIKLEFGAAPIKPRYLPILPEVLGENHGEMAAAPGLGLGFFFPNRVKTGLGTSGKPRCFFGTTVPRLGTAVFTQFREVSQQRTVVQDKVPAEDRGSGK